MAAVMGQYPANIKVDYPEKLGRLTTFFRIFLAIPILALLSFFVVDSGDWANSSGWRNEYSALFILFVPVMLMIVIRQKYPRWWFDWNVALTKFFGRINAYLALLRDEYPSTDEEQAVHINIEYPDVKQDLNRWMPLVKWFLAIPHFIVLWFLGVGVVVSVIIAWFAILFTERYPKALFDYVVGVFRWWLRVQAYAFLLTTDDYPPFRLSE
jgi:hypothetical protein